MDHRMPQPGELQLVVLLGSDHFIAWAPANTLDALLDAAEGRFGITPEDRSDQVRQAMLRAHVARLLAARDAAAFTDRLAAACLWLAFRHWSNGEVMRDALARQMEERGAAILSVCIEDSPEAQPGTSWAFLLGDRVHDARERLRTRPAGSVLVEMGPEG